MNCNANRQKTHCSSLPNYIMPWKTTHLDILNLSNFLSCISENNFLDFVVVFENKLCICNSNKPYWSNFLHLIFWTFSINLKIRIYRKDNIEDSTEQLSLKLLEWSKIRMEIHILKSKDFSVQNNVKIWGCTARSYHHLQKHWYIFFLKMISLYLYL